MSLGETYGKIDQRIDQRSLQDVGTVYIATNRGRPEASNGEKGKEEEGRGSGITLILNSDCQTGIE